MRRHSGLVGGGWWYRYSLADCTVLSLMKFASAVVPDTSVSNSPARTRDTGYFDSMIGRTSPMIRPSPRVSGNVIAAAVINPTPCDGPLSGSGGMSATGESQVISDLLLNRTSVHGLAIMKGMTFSRAVDNALDV